MGDSSKPDGVPSAGHHDEKTTAILSPDPHTGDDSGPSTLHSHTERFWSGGDNLACFPDRSKALRNHEAVATEEDSGVGGE